MPGTSFLDALRRTEGTDAVGTRDGTAGDSRSRSDAGRMDGAMGDIRSRSEASPGIDSAIELLRSHGIGIDRRSASTSQSFTVDFMERLAEAEQRDENSIVMAQLHSAEALDAMLFESGGNAEAVDLSDSFGRRRDGASGSESPPPLG